MIWMARRTDELLGQQATVNMALVFARRWRGSVAGSTGRTAVRIHHTQWNTARALVATQAGNLRRPARKVLAVAFLAKTEIEVGLDQQRAVKIRLVGIQNPGRVHRGCLLQRTRLGTSHDRYRHGHYQSNTVFHRLTSPTEKGTCICVQGSIAVLTSGRMFWASISKFSDRQK
jgi:hypothetical protein